MKESPAALATAMLMLEQRRRGAGLGRPRQCRGRRKWDRSQNGVQVLRNTGPTAGPLTMVSGHPRDPDSDTLVSRSSTSRAHYGIGTPKRSRRQPRSVQTKTRAVSLWYRDTQEIPTVGNAFLLDRVPNLLWHRDANEISTAWVSPRWWRRWLTMASRRHRDLDLR